MPLTKVFLYKVACDDCGRTLFVDKSTRAEAVAYLTGGSGPLWTLDAEHVNCGDCPPGTAYGGPNRKVDFA